MKCDNCDRDAVYMVNRPTANTVYFCAYDIPAEMREAAINGDYAFPEEAPATKKKSADPVVEPEAPVEAPVEGN